jgi:RimJ/RimL family protein N-acetyltransferase
MDELETARLHLRMFTPGDLDELYPIFSDPRVVKYMKDGAPISRQETELALISIIKHWARNGFGRWAAIHKETQRLIGYGGLRNLYGMPELVYLLDYPYWGRGLATEIARACLDWGFAARRFERIIAVTKPDNLASRRVMEKVGMSYEKDANYYGIDCVFYAVSRQTYHALHCLEQLPLERLAHNHPLERHSRG